MAGYSLHELAANSSWAVVGCGYRDCSAPHDAGRAPSVHRLARTDDCASRSTRSQTLQRVPLCMRLAFRRLALRASRAANDFKTRRYHFGVIESAAFKLQLTLLSQHL